VTIAAIYEKLTSVFREVFHDETIVLGPETTAEDIEGWDSVNHIRLIVSIETEFRVKFTIEEIVETANVGEFVSLIERKT
jgi:acyl carrier protein